MSRNLGIFWVDQFGDAMYGDFVRDIREFFDKLISGEEVRLSFTVF